MAKKAVIPITDHNTSDVCTSYYALRLKTVDATGYTVLPNQYGTVTGSPAFYAIILENLSDEIEYDLEITRHCCEGTQSNPVVVNFFAENT